MPDRNISQIKADLDAWAIGGGKREQRDVALQRINVCFENPYELSLDLSELGLTEAPPHFPATLESMNLRGNRLKAFSTQLPDCLKDLKLNRNALAEIKAALPEGLKRLDLSYNQLPGLPVLPNSLESLAAAKNLMSELPPGLSISLETDFEKYDNYARTDNRYAAGKMSDAAHAGQPGKALREPDVLAGFRQKNTEAEAGFGRLEKLMAGLDAPVVAQKAPEMPAEMPPMESIAEKFTPLPVLPDRPVQQEAKASKAPARKPALQASLNPVRHTKEKIPAAPGFVMDSRFGEFGYSRENPPSYPNHQLRLTTECNSGSKASALNRVELEDTGYAAHIEYADGRRKAIVPGAVSYIAHTADAMHGRGFSLPLPPVINANIVHLPQSEGRADYLAFSVSEPNPENTATISNTHYVPFGTYQQQDGTIIGIAYCGDRQIAYSFEVASQKIPLEGNAAVTLTLATEHEVQCMSQFQITIFSELHALCPILSGATQLKNEPADVQKKFDAVFERNRETIDDAIAAERRFPDLVERMLGKLVGRRTGDPKLRSMLKTISQGWKSMRDSMSYLKLQSPNAVGFFEVEDNLKGRAKNGLMKMPVDLQHINSPLMAFSRPLFMDESVPLDMLASLLRHEWSHGFLETSDQMDPRNARVVYPTEDATFRTISLADIEYFASLKGSKPENHAATLEYFTEMCGYLSDAGKRDRVMGYLKSPASHGFIRGPLPGDRRVPVKPPMAIPRRARTSAPMTAVRLGS
ncbi:hypothetical protein D9O50_14100 [Oxalobacteraceae bacterium CAVE-383]|nr:hypothetical protein D9O50_14100 [Oxalobacteraceae bacterium CAVE-383]